MIVSYTACEFSYGLIFLSLILGYRNIRRISLTRRSLLLRIHVNHGPLQQNCKEEYEPSKMRCYRKILRIINKDHVTNDEVCAKIQQAIGPHENFLTIVKRRKQKWYGHISLSSGLAKTILQTTVKGGKRQGRQKKRWEDNMREWTGLEFAKSQRAVENGEKWRKLVVKSSVVPQRSPRLRDKWKR